MKLVPSLLALAIAGSVVPDAAAAQKARPDLVAGSAAAGAIPQPDYILNTCKETESTGTPGDPRSAFRAVSPAGMLAVYLQNYDKRTVDMAMLSAIKTNLLQGPQHGDLLSSVSNTGHTTYRYDPTPNYIGNDRTVFLAQFEGKVYKIVINLVVSLQVNENPLTDEQTPVCPEPTLIKVN